MTGLFIAMSQNLTQIANSALIKLGATTISSITDSLREASLARERMIPTIHRLLRDHCWHFATKMVQLPPILDPGEIGDWTYAFQIPADCLRLRKLSVAEYEVVGDRILSDESTIHLRYTQRLVDNAEAPGLLPDDFADAVALFLAYEIAPSVTNSLQMRDDMLAAGNRTLAFARFNGAVEVPQLTTNSSEWLDARLVPGSDDRRLYPLDV